VNELISVIIAVYNRADALAAVLRSLARQSDRNFEIVIADDGSGEGVDRLKACRSPERAGADSQEEPWLTRLSTTRSRQPAGHRSSRRSTNPTHECPHPQQVRTCPREIGSLRNLGWGWHVLGS